MALWLVRIGKYGQHEQQFLDNDRIYLCWTGLSRDLSALPSRDALKDVLRKTYPDDSERRLGINTGQIWRFAKQMQPGDWAVVPSKRQPAVHVCEITGDYTFEQTAQDPYYHHHTVRWIEQDIPRSRFDKDLLASLRSLMTICQISRNDAENRVRRMFGKQPVGRATEPGPTAEPEAPDDSEGPIDLQEAARDEIAQLIIAKFKGHGMERLVEAILQAQGYTTHHSPVGPDKGIDILAAPGGLGFGEPRICVQVKSTDGPIDLPTLNQLVGSMENVRAKQGLLVSWGGFKSSVDRERAAQFFRVRLWDQNDLIEQLLTHYDKLDDDIRGELPLKQIWIVATQEDEN